MSIVSIHCPHTLQSFHVTLTSTNSAKWVSQSPHWTWDGIDKLMWTFNQILIPSIKLIVLLIANVNINNIFLQSSSFLNNEACVISNIVANTQSVNVASFKFYIHVTPSHTIFTSLVRGLQRYFTATFRNKGWIIYTSSGSHNDIITGSSPQNNVVIGQIRIFF